LAVSNWPHSATSLGIEYQPDIKILGVNFRPKIKEAIDTNWRKTIQATRETAHKSYHRSLCLAKRIQFVRIYLFAKIWFLAQILPPTDSHIRQINGIASWFIWQGSIFRVPLTTLQRRKAEGGWGLDDVQVKCKMLLYSGMEKAKHRADSTTTLLLKEWNVDATFANPPNKLTKAFVRSHLSRYLIDMAYIPAKGISEAMREYKRRMTPILHTL
jgi:hypothetical protein